MNCICFERTSTETMIVVLNQFNVNLENYVTFAVFIEYGIRLKSISLSKSPFQQTFLRDNLSEVSFFHQLDWLFANIHNRLQSFPNSVKRLGNPKFCWGIFFYRVMGT